MNRRPVIHSSDLQPSRSSSVNDDGGGRAQDAVIRTVGLCKSFKERRPGEGELAWKDGMARLFLGRSARDDQRVPALNGVDLEVQRGEVLGVLGLNGAGKTTLLKILTAQLVPDSGEASIHGYDIWTQRRQVRSVVSLVKFGGWQNTLFQLTVRGNLEFYAKLNGLPRDLAMSRIDEALDLLGLSEKANEYPWYLSAGQLQKLNLAQVFLVRTPLVVLDEPTAHLDPVASRQVRSFIKEVVNGRLEQTVVLTTHYVYEAEDLCDRIAFLHEGRVMCLGTPAELKMSMGEERTLHVDCARLVSRKASELTGQRWSIRRPASASGHDHLVLALSSGQRAASALSMLRGQDIQIAAAWVDEPSIEDLFVSVQRSVDSYAS